MNLEIIDKIRKLLALAENASATSDESALALQRAQEIALKYELDLVRIKEEKPLEKSQVVGGEKIKQDDDGLVQSYVSDILQRHFRVSVVYTYPKSLVLIGKPTDIEIATHVQVYLTREFHRLLGIFLQSKGRGAPASYFKASYYLGLWQGLMNKLKEQEKELLRRESSETQSSFALVLKSGKDQRDAKLKELFPNCTTRETNYGKHDLSRDAFADGLEDGRKIELNKALREQEQKRKLI